MLTGTLDPESRRKGFWRVGGPRFAAAAVPLSSSSRDDRSEDRSDVKGRRAGLVRDGAQRLTRPRAP